MMLIAVIIGFGLGALLLRRRNLAEGSAAAIGPAEKNVKATVDGVPVHSYVADD